MPWLNRRYAAWQGHGECCRTTRLWGVKLPQVLGFQRPRAANHAGVHYNLLTAADEKITLSVGHVKHKPQYLVFCLQLGHLLSKQKGRTGRERRTQGGVRNGCVS